MRDALILIRTFLGKFSHREFIALLLILIVSASYIPIPLLLRRIIGQLQLDQIDMDLLVSQCLFLFGVFAFQTVGVLVSRKILVNYIRDSVQQNRSKLLGLYLNNSTPIKSESLSSLHKKLYSDTEMSDRFFNSLLTNIIPALVIATVSFGIMVYINTILMLVVLTLSVFTVLIIQYFKRKRDSAFSEYQTNYESFNKLLLFVLRFKQLISMQSMEKREHENIHNNLVKLKDKGVQMEMSFSKATSIQEFSQSSILVIILFVSAWLKTAGKIELEVILIFFFMMYVLRKQFLSISNHLQNMSEGIYALKNLNELEVSLRNSTDQYNANSLKKVKFNGSLKFENVYFNYDQHSILLKNVTFSLLPKKINLIQGVNGVGKSTLMLLTLGYLKPNRGSILIEGIDSASLDFHSFRKSVGAIFQENELFEGTIRDNLTYGIDSNKNGVLKALNRVGMAEWVNQLPDKLDTEINELNKSISGGQKQRLMLARALLQKPNLLILDEPTNHLDLEFIKSLIDIFKSLKNSITIMLISHDDRLAKIADQKLLIHAKRIEVS